MATETGSGLTLGERAPDLVLPTADGTATRWYARAGGRPTLVVLAGDDPDAARQLGAALDDDLDVHLIGPAGRADVPGMTYLDPEGRAAKAWRTGPAARAFLLGRDLRVLDSFEPAVPGVVSAVRERVGQLHETGQAPRVIAHQAPVLLVPDVLDAAACAELIAAWETDHRDTGVEATTEDGRRAEQLTDQLKRRADHVVHDPARSRALAQHIGRRVIPEVARAFVYRARQFEGFKVACYTADSGGFFRPHRDNLSQTTAHRRFALSLNLNDDYEGGELRFGEYGDDLYRPPAGGALVFSCAHLHEVLPVTRGRRFVLLSFLFNTEES